MPKHVKTTVKAKTYILCFVHTNTADNTSISVVYIFLKLIKRHLVKHTKVHNMMDTIHYSHHNIINNE